MGGLGLVRIIKEIVEGRSIENDFIIAIINDNFLPSIKYIVTMDRGKTAIVKAYQL